MPDANLPSYLKSPFPVLSKRGVATCDHPAASQLAGQIVEAGGSAVDAAMAVSLALGAVCPYYTGLGGGGFALVWFPGWEAPRCLDFREVAPGAASADMYGGGASSTLGGCAVGVPGCLAGWALLHQEFGRLSWREVLLACAEICERGFPIDPNYLRVTASKIDQIRQFPELGRVFLQDGQVPNPNYWMRNPDLGATYRRLAEMGPREFYEGRLGQQVVEAAQSQGGRLSSRDLACYQPRWREPLAFPYRGRQLFSVGPPSAGGIQLAQMCAILEAFSLEEPGSACDLHLLSEAMKISFYERSNWVSDPEFCEVPLDWLLERERLRRWAGHICPNFTLKMPDELPQRIPVGGTASYSVATLDAGVVIATESVNLWWGSMVVPRGCGFPLNNVMDDFCCHPGQPDAFGLYSSKANEVQAGKRPASSSAPVMAFEQGHPIMTAGSAGGPRIATSVAHMLFHHLDYGMNVQQAVTFPRVHHQWKPDVLHLEPQICHDVRRELSKFGHHVAEDLCRSHGCATTIDWEAGVLAAGFDFRSGGAAFGL